ncbi:MAG: phospholipase/carboxylesterase [Acidobacteriota bacterium]|jgi:phospholipase/carboxylesterase
MSINAVPVLDGPRLDRTGAGQATGLVVLLHGHRSNGHDLIHLARQVQPVLPEVAFAAPDGPQAIGAGRRWFELTSPDPAVIWRGAVGARRSLDRFLDAERDRLGITDKQIVLVGFSQGAVMALHVGLRRPALAGIIGYAGFLAGQDQLGDITARPPITLVHGDKDGIVPVQAMHAAAAALKHAGLSVTTHVVRGLGHSINLQGVMAGVQAIQQALFVKP